MFQFQIYELDEDLDEELFVMTQTISNYIDLINQNKDLTLEEEIECIEKSNTPKYKEKLFNSHLKLVFGIARKYIGSGIPLEDLIQEGIVGLNIALERFDPTKKCRFSTISAWWIKCQIMEYIRNNMHGFKITAGFSNKIYSLSKSIIEYNRIFDKNPSDEELSDYLSIPIQDVVKLRGYLLPTISINERIAPEREYDFSFEEILMDEKKNGFEIAVLSDDLKIIRAAIDKLSDIQKNVLIERYGLDGDDELTLKEIAVKLNLTPERVRQIQDLAEKNIKSFLKNEF